MKPVIRLTHKFVEFIPDQVEDGVLYVSLEYATAVHNCCCGCGNHVVTPLKPVSWQLTFDGESISLYPSIGNWSFPCRSHYWISNSVVEWSYGMTDHEIQAGRQRDQRLRDTHFRRPTSPAAPSGDKKRGRLENWWRRFLK
jgi:Family of unknown function (DUF6527)